MLPIYLTATTLREFGADRLAGHLLCTLREQPGFRGHPSVLARNLASVEDEASLRAAIEASVEAAAYDGIPQALAAATAAYVHGGNDEAAVLDGWREEVLRRVGDAPYRPGSPTLQLPFPARMAVEVPALLLAGRRKLEGGSPLPELIEAVAPPDGTLSFGTGDIPIAIVGDPEDTALPAMLDAAAASLATAPRAVRWIWMNAPRTETPLAVALCLERERRLARLQHAPIEAIAAALREPLPAIPPPARLPPDPRTATVLQQTAILDACGVPRSGRPALLIGRRLHVGTCGDLAADIDAVRPTK